MCLCNLVVSEACLDTTVRSEPHYTSTINFIKKRSVSLQFGCIRSVSDTTVRSEPHYTSTINFRKGEKYVSLKMS